MTNEEIAQRMGITLDGAKFHVSEILGKLGLASRYEAASWRPESAPARGSRFFALAPLTLLHKVKVGTVGYALGAVVTAGVAVGVGLLLWGIVASRDGQGAPSTGIAALDSVLAMIERQDAGALAARARFQPTACGGVGPSGAFPCPEGVAEGTLLPRFQLLSCEASSATSIEGVRAAFQAVFAKNGASSIYAVGQAPLVKNGDPDYVAIVTQGRQPSPAAPATIWYIGRDGTVDQLVYECGGPMGAAIDIELFGLAGTGFTLAPRASCPAASTASNIVVDSTIGINSDRPRLLGTVLARDATPTTERVIVEVPSTARLAGLTSLAAVQSGTRLRVTGRRSAECFLEAETISLGG